MTRSVSIYNQRFLKKNRRKKLKAKAKNVARSAWSRGYTVSRQSVYRQQSGRGLVVLVDEPKKRSMRYAQSLSEG